MQCTRWPCQWPADASVADLPDAVKDAAVEGAGNILWALTGRWYGVCSTVEQYRLDVDTGCVIPVGPGPLDVAGHPTSANMIPLAQRPVRSVESVKVGGAVVSDWFRQGSMLVRRGGYWPAVGATDPPNIEVSYTFGGGFPGGSSIAVGELANELVQAYRGKECRIPSNATTITRNGVTVTRLDAVSIAATGLVGLPVTDMLIRSLNPAKLTQPSRVYSVDGARRG